MLLSLKKNREANYMRIINFFLITCFYFISLSHAQTTTDRISGDYAGVKLADFLSEIEKKTSYRFYYKTEWISDIMVNRTIIKALVPDVLSEILAGSNLNFYIDDGKNVILYSGDPIITRLPDYSIDLNDSELTDINKVELSDSEGIRYTSESDDIRRIIIGSKSNKSRRNQFVISGRILSAETGNPVIGATIFIQETEKGAATDVDGYFKLMLPKGEFTANVNSLTMQEKVLTLEVYADGSIEIMLKEELQKIDEVVVSGNRNNLVSGMQMGLEHISMKSIKEIPAVMGEKDLLKVAQLMAGVQSAGEGSSGIIVRGGNADQNLFYINELPVYNTSHLFGFFSAFNPDIIRDYTLYKSHIPVNFGGRVSSVFDISTRPGNKKEFYGKGGISPVTSHIAIEGPIQKDKSSFLLSYRTTYSNWLLRQINNVNLQNSSASFYDLSASVNTQVNEKNLVKVFFYKSGDKFSLSNFDEYNYDNTGGVIFWKHLFSSSFSMDLSGVLSQYNFLHNSQSNPSEAFSHNYELDHYEFKSEFLWQTLNNQRIKFGFSNILYELDRGNIDPFGSESTRIPIALETEKGLEQAVFLSDEFNISSNLKIYAGIRYSIYSFLGAGKVNTYMGGLPKGINTVSNTRSFANNELIKRYHGPEPRVVINYLFNKYSSIKASYNRSQQFIYMLSNTLAISPTDQWKLSDYYNKPIKADQASAGYYYNFPSKPFEFSVEVYQKWLKDVVEYKDGADFISDKPAEMYLLQGNQDVKGLELMLRKNAGKLTGWLAYSYSNSTILVDNPHIPDDNINYGERYPSNYDIPHSINLVANLRTSRRISFSANLVYSTGRPVTYPVAVYYSGDNSMLHYSQRNEYRLPDYFRTDFSLTFDGNLLAKKWLHSTWMLNVYNLTGRRNAYSVFFNNEDGVLKGYKLSVFGRPIVTLSWNFKFGNYVSE